MNKVKNNNPKIENGNSPVFVQLNNLFLSSINDIKSIAKNTKRDRIEKDYNDSLRSKKEDETIFLYLADFINKEITGSEIEKKDQYISERFAKFIDKVKEIISSKKKIDGDYSVLKDNPKVKKVFENITLLVEKIKNIINLEDNFSYIKNSFNFKSKGDEEQKKEFLEYFVNMFLMNFCKDNFKNNTGNIYDAYITKYFDTTVKNYQNTSDIRLYSLCNLPLNENKSKQEDKKKQLENYLEKKGNLFKKSCDFLSKSPAEKSNTSSSYPLFLFNGNIVDNLKREQLEILKDINNFFILKNEVKHDGFSVVPVDFNTGFGKTYLIEKINQELATKNNTKNKDSKVDPSNAVLITVGLNDVYDDEKFDSFVLHCKEELEKLKGSNAKLIFIFDEFSEFTNDRMEKIKEIMNQLNKENISIITMPFSATLPDGLLDEKRLKIKQEEARNFENDLFGDKSKPNIDLNKENINYEELDDLIFNDTEDLKDEKDFNLQLILPDLSSKDFEIVFNKKLAQVLDVRGINAVFYKNERGNYCAKYKQKGNWVNSKEYDNLQSFEEAVADLKEKKQLSTDKIITIYTENNAVGGDMGWISKNITTQLIYTNSKFLTQSQLRQYIGRNRDNQNSKINGTTKIIVRNPICTEKELLKDNDVFFGNYTSLALEEIKVKSNICEHLKKIFYAKIYDGKINKFIFSDEFTPIYDLIKGDIFANNSISTSNINLLFDALKKNFGVVDTPENRALLKTKDLKNIFTKLNNLSESTNNLLSKKNFNYEEGDLKNVKNLNLSELTSKENFILKDIERLKNKIEICAASYIKEEDVNSKTAKDNIEKYNKEIEKCIDKLNEIRQVKNKILSGPLKNNNKKYDIKEFIDISKIDYNKQKPQKTYTPKKIIDKKNQILPNKAIFKTNNPYTNNNLENNDNVPNKNNKKEAILNSKKDIKKSDSSLNSSIDDIKQNTIKQENLDNSFGEQDLEENTLGKDTNLDLSLYNEEMLGYLYEQIKELCDLIKESLPNDLGNLIEDGTMSVKLKKILEKEENVGKEEFEKMRNLLPEDVKELDILLNFIYKTRNYLDKFASSNFKDDDNYIIEQIKKLQDMLMQNKENGFVIQEDFEKFMQLFNDVISICELREQEKINSTSKLNNSVSQHNNSIKKNEDKGTLVDQINEHGMGTQINREEDFIITNSFDGGGNSLKTNSYNRIDTSAAADFLKTKSYHETDEGEDFIITENYLDFTEINQKDNKTKNNLNFNFTPSKEIIIPTNTNMPKISGLYEQSTSKENTISTNKFVPEISELYEVPVDEIDTNLVSANSLKKKVNSYEKKKDSLKKSSNKIKKNKTKHKKKKIKVSIDINDSIGSLDNDIINSINSIDSITSVDNNVKKI